MVQRTASLRLNQGGAQKESSCPMKYIIRWKNQNAHNGYYVHQEL